jgi:2-polyprenyl-3-methyl-5-hydroxy-6-metoxy-1,4-benzoquinol methylase
MGIDYDKYDDLPENYYGIQRLEMLRHLPEDAKIILDVGCGEGGFAELIKKQRDAEVWGIELYPKAAARAEAKLDRLYVGNIEMDQFDLPEEYFDCIVFNDVLEHLYYPWDVLEKVKKFLKNGGYVLASIPNIRYLEQVVSLVLKGDWDYGRWGIMDRTHLRFFTLKSMRKMFEQSGYTVLNIEGINPGEFSWKFEMLYWLFGKRIWDMRYLQFGCLVKK